MGFNSAFKGLKFERRITDEIKDMSGSVGTWKLRVAYLIWLINEDFLTVSFHNIALK